MNYLILTHIYSYTEPQIQNCGNTIVEECDCHSDNTTCVMTNILAVFHGTAHSWKELCAGGKKWSGYLITTPFPLNYINTAPAVVMRVLPIAISLQKKDNTVVTCLKFMR